jgi:hypothetical protein
VDPEEGIMRAAQGLGIAVALALLGAVAGVASAQMPNGPFERLSPGNQRIARALHEAQRREPPPGTRRLTVDEIAARRGEQGWHGMFREMKAQGLVTEKKLTHIVERREGRRAW